MASPRTRSLLLLICGALLVLAWPSAAQRGGERGRQLSWPTDSPGQQPGRPGRPGGGGGSGGGGGGEFWPGAGGSGGTTPPPAGGEFWPGAGPGGSAPSTTTRRPGGGSPSGCSCPSTPEYNPVCGTDGVSYGNPGKLNCARTCGRSVSILHYGNCTPADPNAPTTTSSTPPPSSTRRGGRRQ